MGWASKVTYDLFWWIRMEKILSNRSGIYYVCNHHLGDTFIFCSYLSKLNRITGKNHGVIVPEFYDSIPKMFGLNYVLTESMPKNRGFNDIFYFLAKALRMNTLPSVCAYIDAIKLGGKNKVDLYTGPTVFLGLMPKELPDKPIYFSIGAKEEVNKIIKSAHFTGDKGVIIAPYAKTLNELPNDFWMLLSNRLKEQGYTIFTNVSKKEKELPGTIPVSLSPDEMIILAKEIGWVISIRSGLCDLLLPAGISLTVIYSEDFLKSAKYDIYINADVQKMFPSVVDQIVLENHNEIDFLSAVEKISNS